MAIESESSPAWLLHRHVLLSARYCDSRACSFSPTCHVLPRRIVRDSCYCEYSLVRDARLENTSIAVSGAIWHFQPSVLRDSHHILSLSTSLCALLPSLCSLLTSLCSLLASLCSPCTLPNSLMFRHRPCADITEMTFSHEASINSLSKIIMEQLRCLGEDCNDIVKTARCRNSNSADSLDSELFLSCDVMFVRTPKMLLCPFGLMLEVQLERAQKPGSCLCLDAILMLM